MSRSPKTILFTFLVFLILFGLLPGDRPAITILRENDLLTGKEASTHDGAIMSAGPRLLTRSDFFNTLFQTGNEYKRWI